jgi:hypothetical protein
MLARLLTLLAFSATVLVPAAQTAPLAAPTGLRAFLLRADQPIADTFPRTPSFAWTPYDRAQSYDFELSTSKSFDDSAIVWSTAGRASPLQVPAVAIPVALPWMTGSPYALYAHVRAHTHSGLSRWSTPFGFNMRWKAAPQALGPDVPGLVRWRPIEGATSYDVWFVDAGKVIATTSNVADEREYYSFHPDATWTTTVRWRVRAVRKIYGSLPSGLPVVTVGPWSETFVSANPLPTTGGLSPYQTASDVLSTDSAPAAHSLTPGFAYNGDTGTNGVSGRLFRVYVATDRQCVNIVFRGSVVGSPAYVPRTSGPLALPTSPTAVTAAETAYLADGAQSGTFTADLRAVTTSEQDPAATTSPSTSTTPTTPAPTTTTPPPTTGTSNAGGTIPSDFSATGTPVDLWDSGWPTGRYFWTVVPVREVTSSGAIQYLDAEIPQDACAAGRAAQFGKSSQPATTSTTTPYASGLSPSGELVAARTRAPSFYRAALVAWVPALGATGYEVQWSRTKYPWKSASATPFYTAATSALLEGLAPGTWYYRVRGIDPYVLGPIKQMTWSAPVQFKLVKPTFIVQTGVTTRPVKK